MVRLVFRPYTQLRRSICTSESLRSSIRVSPDFNLARHSSPSFGSQHLYSVYTQQCEVDWMSRDCALRIVPRADKLLFAFTAPLGLVNPMARIHVRLLGPCFKTGRRGRRPTRQRDENRNRALLAIRVLSRTRRAQSQDTRGCKQNTYNFARGLWSEPNGSCRKLLGKCTREPSRTKRTVIADQIHQDRPTPRLSSTQKLREPLRLPPHSFTYY
jgi:hypothetical protein